MHVATVSFDQLNASLLNKVNFLFISLSILTIHIAQPYSEVYE